MEGGDRESADGVQLSARAGVIPRAIKQIFDTLKGKTDYTVKVSFLELYNEEITDLLAAGVDENRKLPIRDDGSGSIHVANLEEVIVKNALEIYSVLDRGTSRRTSAETLLNKQSSRSHSVFTITIHMRDTTPEGEEIIKVGKLNLVDLAGSENISRSGAKDQRAREAGEINKSLLCLGRVISALVEKQGYVPYRDSKLTRLLRESLGGKAKTCIIATIAPTVHCLEETINTLDYAHRAKNIRNKPEVNQKVSKAAMLKEYAGEIDKLHAQLMAAREKDGVFLPVDQVRWEPGPGAVPPSRPTPPRAPSTRALSGRPTPARSPPWSQYNEMEAGLKERTERVEELEKEAETAREEMAHLRKRLERKETQLSLTRDAHAQVTESLEAALGDLRTAREEAAVRGHALAARAVAEDRLAAHAGDVTRELSRTASELTAALTKVDAQARAAAANRGTVAGAQEHIVSGLARMAEALTDAARAQAEGFQALTTGAAASLERSRDHASAVEAQLSSLSALAGTAAEAHKASVQLLSDKAAAACGDLSAEAAARSEAAEAALRELVAAVRERADAAAAALQEQGAALGALVEGGRAAAEAVEAAARKLGQVARSALDRAADAAREGGEAAEAQAQAQVEAAAAARASFEAESRRLQEEVVQQMREALEAFVVRGNGLMSHAVGSVTASIEQGAREMSARMASVTEAAAAGAGHVQAVEDEACGLAQQGADATAAGAGTVSEQLEAAGADALALADVVAERADAEAAAGQAAAQGVAKLADRAAKECRKEAEKAAKVAKKGERDALKGIAAVQEGARGNLASVEAAAQEGAAAVAAAAEAAEAFSGAQGKTISGLQVDVRKRLGEDLVDVAESGSTPKKRKVAVPAGGSVDAMRAGSDEALAAEFEQLVRDGAVPAVTIPCMPPGADLAAFAATPRDTPREGGEETPTGERSVTDVALAEEESVPEEGVLGERKNVEDNQHPAASKTPVKTPRASRLRKPQAAADQAWTPAKAGGRQ